MTKWVAAMVLAVFVLAPCPGAAQAKEHRVEIADLKYKPAKLKVKKGDTVVWVNKDDRDHTVVAKAKSKDDKDKGGGFDSGKIAAGDTYSHAFDKPGQFEYGCE